MKLNRFWIGSALMLGVAAFGSAAAAAEEPAMPAAAATMEDNLDNLEFASGEATSFDAASGKLQVKVYLDDAGNPSENTIELNVDTDTEITNGEKDLDATALKTGVEIDVEYDKNSNKATYVFVY
ncbi:MAG: hypothetical protein KBD07_01165 [Candidatus Omnitrophica bacterium]|jgi:hypothetical protein|nr:hypothetical protein [Candidatus Omnitrophota bacterium]